MSAIWRAGDASTARRSAFLGRDETQKGRALALTFGFGRGFHQGCGESGEAYHRSKLIRQHKKLFIIRQSLRMEAPR